MRTRTTAGLGGAGVLAAGLALLVGCASPAPAASPTRSAAATTDPALVTTGHAVTVLDAGGGAELCLGAVFTSLPPQCGGPVLVGWDWSEYTKGAEEGQGDYTERAGVRWGLFTVTGAYDTATHRFTPTAVVPGATEQGQGGTVDLSTPCPEPPGGWRVLDAAKTTDASMNAVFEAAARLEDYSASWVDTSRVPRGDPKTPEEELMETAPRPLLTIVDVKVTGDVTAAEAALRKVWGGMLCVTKGERTAAQLRAIQEELSATTASGDLLGVGVDEIAGTVDLEVVHDDGTLQARLDEKYGVGLVHVSSALVPAG